MTWGSDSRPKLATAASLREPSRAPRYLEQMVKTTASKPQPKGVKLGPRGPDRLCWVDQSDRLDSRPGSRSVFRSVSCSWPSQQLRRGSQTLSSGAHQIHGFQQHTVHPNEPSTPHL